jgi:uncharacterized membrane protein
MKYKFPVNYFSALLLMAVSMLMIPFSKLVFIILFIVFAVIGLFVNKNNFLLSTISVMLILLFLQGLAYLIDVENTIFFRPLEVLTQKEVKVNKHGEMEVFYHLKPNTELEMESSYGDLYNMTDKNSQILTPEKKNLLYITDGLGFRNYSEYTNQKHILIGDSFLVGANLSQESLLNYQLRDKYGFDSYNFSHVLDIQGYVTYIERLKKILDNREWKAIVFLFEGNDFYFQDSGAKSRFYRFVSFWRALPLYKVIYSLWSRAIFNITNKLDSGSVPVYSYVINQNKVGFFRPYIKQTNQKTFTQVKVLSPLLGVKDKIELIVFIPTKYRVYHDFFKNSSEHSSLPHAKWDYLNDFCSINQLNCVDLTHDLKARSRELIKKNLFTYDKDDTHWSRLGVEVAADVVYSEIAKLENHNPLNTKTNGSRFTEFRSDKKVSEQ